MTNKELVSTYDEGIRTTCFVLIVTKVLIHTPFEVTQNKHLNFLFNSKIYFNVLLNPTTTKIPIFLKCQDFQRDYLRKNITNM